MKESRAMMNLSGTAERLRVIRKAQEHFLALFALECIWNQTTPYERLAQDLASIDSSAQTDASFMCRLSDR